MFDGNLRTGVDRVVAPIGIYLHKWFRITAGHLTFLGLCMATGCMVFIGRDSFLIGFIFFILAGLCDLLDGPVAKAAGTSSTRGAFLDSTADRVTDALILLGMSWHILQNTEESEWLVFLPILILVLTQIISYQRAKAESLGLNAKGGLMERAERFLVLGFAILFNFWLIQTLWVLLGLIAITTIQRFIKIVQQPEPA